MATIKEKAQKLLNDKLEEFKIGRTAWLMRKKDGLESESKKIDEEIEEVEKSTKTPDDGRDNYVI